MTNKELKRASYIFAKKQADILLTLTEQSFWLEHEQEYLESDYHKKYDILSDEDAQALRKRFNIPENVDVKEFFISIKNKTLQKKFPEKVMLKKDGK